MAVGLNQPARLFPVDGIELASVAAGIRYQNRADLLLISIAAGSTSVGVFTQNKFCAAPVIVAKQHLALTEPSAFLINSGNANAGTGAPGIHAALKSCVLVAEQLALDPEQVLPFSTGVIGEQLNMLAMGQGIELVTRSPNSDAWLEAAQAIMTTDTVAKGTSRQLQLDGHSVTITGIAKGSGMICPNMATMLSYIATDATIDKNVLQAMLEQANDASFNRITVDSDTSTNDACMLTATGQSTAASIDRLNSPAATIFCQALEEVMVELATSIIRDAEGATKFVKIDVHGGASTNDCEQIAYSVAHSPLVKTALFASDPNWGRLLAAIGKTPLPILDVSRISIRVNDLLIVANGEPVESYTEAAGKREFSKDEISISIDLAVGEHGYHVWTSDLSHDYVSINADYRS